MKAYVDILGHDRPGTSQNNSQPIRAVNHGRGYTGAAAENGCSLRVPASRVANGGPIDALRRQMIPVAATTAITATAAQNLHGGRERNYIKGGRRMLKIPRRVVFIWGKSFPWLRSIFCLGGLHFEIDFASVDSVAIIVDRGTAPPTKLFSAHLLGYDPLSGHWSIAGPQGGLCRNINHPIIFASDRTRLPYDHTCARISAFPTECHLFPPRLSDCVPGSTYMLNLKEPTSTIQALRRKSSIDAGGTVRIVVREDPRSRIHNPWDLAASWSLHDKLFLLIPYHFYRAIIFVVKGGGGSGGGAIRLILRLDRGLEIGGGGLAVCMCQQRYEVKAVTRRVAGAGGWPVRPGVTVADAVRHARGPAPTGSASFGNTCHEICPTLGAHLLKGVVKCIDKDAVPILATVLKEYRYKD
ncbi:uncharacterized protein BO96DRAFT_435611 [Aspergillus niger CBS 101883]|uniref:uncharacterized protein n=1 Tax=Aspergillus lacticoffeatus (strain CBS 101883) TaxID=1450533 RepID=UPI000D7FE25A|nr:uncharacterized protein BO96DRAFT_435611 [Aspergillus niger CBS 101883]PYH54835.1 hypothetical protein BO96DRAFT_435611 [Aspergillus niger CBS 101883]